MNDTHLGFHGDTTDVPIGIGSCHLSVDVTIISFVLARGENKLGDVQYLANLSLGTICYCFQNTELLSS